MGACGQIRRFTLNADDYTEITTPVDCSYYAILGTADGSSIVRSSDPENVDAWHEITGSYAFIVPPTSSAARWSAGSVVTWLKAKTGTAIAIVEFIAS
jgi:hypothetical protein